MNHTFSEFNPNELNEKSEMGNVRLTRITYVRAVISQCVNFRDFQLVSGVS